MGLVQSNPYKLEDEGNVWLLFYGFKAEYICGGFFGVIFLQCCVFSSQCTRSHVRGYTNRSVFIATFILLVEYSFFLVLYLYLHHSVEDCSVILWIYFNLRAPVCSGSLTMTFKSILMAIGSFKLLLIYIKDFRSSSVTPCIIISDLLTFPNRSRLKAFHWLSR